ncbi:unnamed protein product [Aphis gossypii]|uniref:Uncharacterized protein n=1 Tax=Aphis gossypii TaxID=80765 RepID=A0A9P0NFX7_APHGO|nr:unnamed protein product [Aphis gossypii]
MVSAPPPDPLPSFPHNRGRPQFASAAGQPFSHSLFFFLIRLSRTPVSSRRASLLARSTFPPTTTAASIRGGRRPTHAHSSERPSFFFHTTTVDDNVLYTARPATVHFTTIILYIIWFFEKITSFCHLRFIFTVRPCGSTVVLFNCSLVLVIAVCCPIQMPSVVVYLYRLIISHVAFSVH